MNSTNWDHLFSVIQILGLAMLAYMNQKQRQATEGIHRQINSRMDELLRSTGGQARAEGQALGRAEGVKSEQDRERPMPKQAQE